MRVVVVGASGNVGTSVLSALAAESRIEAVVGVCRRLPSRQFAKVEWRSADVVTSPLNELFEGADAVVHLAWAGRLLAFAHSIVSVDHQFTLVHSLMLLGGHRLSFWCPRTWRYFRLSLLSEQVPKSLALISCLALDGLRSLRASLEESNCWRLELEAG